MTQPEPEPKRTIIKMANGTEIDLNSIKVKKYRLRDYNYFGSVAMIATQPCGLNRTERINKRYQNNTLFEFRHLYTMLKFKNSMVKTL